MVQTVDFFPPIVDDPRWFGRIAAANALSDVYAMGGRALTALNLVGWPKDLDVELLGEVMAGGLDKIREAGAVLVGGHSVVDHEIKYGLSVTGEVHPDRFWRNSGAKPGDVLLLTKPIGMGPVANAIKKAIADTAMVDAAIEQMALLNRAAAEALADLQVHGATDVTGFGLIGHGLEMADGAKVGFELDTARLPVFPGALDLVRDGVATGASNRGAALHGARVGGTENVDPALVQAMYDAETSGGLLVAIAAADAQRAAHRLADVGCPASAMIGHCVPRAKDGPALMLL